MKRNVSFCLTKFMEKSEHDLFKVSFRTSFHNKSMYFETLTRIFLVQKVKKKQLNKSTLL